jgi:hypothetical protein
MSMRFRNAAGRFISRVAAARLSNLGRRVLSETTTKHGKTKSRFEGYVKKPAAPKRRGKPAPQSLPETRRQDRQVPPPPSPPPSREGEYDEDIPDRPGAYFDRDYYEAPEPAAIAGFDPLRDEESYLDEEEDFDILDVDEDKYADAE